MQILTKHTKRFSGTLSVAVAMKLDQPLHNEYRKKNSMPDISKWVIWLHTTTYFVGQINEAATMTTVSVFSFCHLVRMKTLFFICRFLIPNVFIYLFFTLVLHFTFTFQVHLLWRSSICHGFTTLRAHSSWHHQGHCYPLCPSEWLPCGPKIWLGLSWLACGKTQILKSHAQYHYKFCVDLQMKPNVANVTRVRFRRSMRLIRLWGSKGRRMWPRWASQSITSSAEALSWDIPKSGRWVSLKY